ncbi:MAG: ferritin family protein [Thermodesulfobacteriota bacterium]
MFSINEILDIAIRLEKNSEAVYREAAGNTSKPEIAAALEWMADEEAKHARWFDGLRDTIDIKPDAASLEELNGDFLKTIIGGQSFSLDDVDFENIEQLSELLDVFVESERDGILFYEMLTPFIREEGTRTMLEHIIKEEHNHIKILNEFIAPAPPLQK